ncbi:hypothetical protein OsJ_15548 [Oryza sativa Japonica Group]|uniref:Uncharacterized protein n=1 Tax=Oryza sativa subsp. japonica TaxID=39947 RepID=B9FG97_ORYSJ|nr:hypothetical protein OsJ_15548 [Oryza sativa Japonica Group]
MVFEVPTRFPRRLHRPNSSPSPALVPEVPFPVVWIRICPTSLASGVTWVQGRAAWIREEGATSVARLRRLRLHLPGAASAAREGGEEAGFALHAIAVVEAGGGGGGGSRMRRSRMALAFGGNSGGGLDGAGGVSLRCGGGSGAPRPASALRRGKKERGADVWVPWLK